MSLATAAAQPASRASISAPTGSIEPIRDPAELRRYIDAHWRTGHILARDERMFDFQYRTPWVDRKIWTTGVSALGEYEGDRLVGFLGAIVAPYPRPQSYWLALWHVLPELKGGGHGGRLLQRMQEIAVGADGRGAGWIGTFGAGPEALPVYLKRGYACRAVRRWIYQTPVDGVPPLASSLHTGETRPPREWNDYRYSKHPIFRYEQCPAGGAIFRTESNEWGLVTHCLRLHASPSSGWRDDVNEVHARESAHAVSEGKPYLMDAWAIDSPGHGWSLAPDDLPSVFHPPAARGNLIYTVGRPFVCSDVQKGECDQDRPN